MSRKRSQNRRRPGSFEDMEKVGKFRPRKKSSQAANLAAEFEKDESQWAEMIASGELFAARVVEVHKRYAFVSREDVRGSVDTRDVWLGTIARKFLQADRLERNLVAVGDRVLVSIASIPDEKTDLPKCVIEHLAPRTSAIRRLDPHTPDRHHVLASNVDQIIIVASYKNPKVKWGLIDRYLVLAESEGVKAIIIINKRDLLEKDQGKDFYADAMEKIDLYRNLGYTVLVTEASAEDASQSDEVNTLRSLCADRINLFTGHSGVGKSSLVNLFDPEIVQAVEEDDNIFYKGRHTTTYASFIKLGTGGYVVDTPGIRSFTFEEMSSIDLSHAFVEMRPYVGQCKYRECRHIDEPDCVVREAVESGAISDWRYKSYLGILLGATGREGRLRDLD